MIFSCFNCRNIWTERSAIKFSSVPTTSCFFQLNSQRHTSNSHSRSSQRWPGLKDRTQTYENTWKRTSISCLRFSMSLSLLPCLSMNFIATVCKQANTFDRLDFVEQNMQVTNAPMATADLLKWYVVMMHVVAGTHLTRVLPSAFVDFPKWSLPH